jgi:hypothetical protein
VELTIDRLNNDGILNTEAVKKLVNQSNPNLGPGNLVK